MKQNLIFSIFLSIFIYQTVSCQEMKVMTYNIRFDDFKNTETSWSHRKDLLGKQLQFYNPDVFGIQEGLINQLQYIDSLLINHQFIGAGRDDGKTKGEYCAIFYNTKRFKVIRQSTFWLSPTPDTVSLGWGATINRICTYALFQSNETKEFIWVFNTHFDHIAELARENSAKLILEKIDELNIKHFPVIFMGDLNTEQESKPIQFISSTLTDSKYNTGLVIGNDGTFNDFKFNTPVLRRIDYVFTSKNNITISKYAVLSDSKNCMYPSDHLPVFVELTINPSK
jgi:endonuclease/exonuclease/phosphatase family metal-dependent hydrolase